MLPPSPDVRVTTPSGRIAVEATEVHWGAGSKRSPTRRPQRAPISGHLPCQLVLAISVEDVRAPPSPGPLTPRLEFVLAIDR